MEQRQVERKLAASLAADVAGFSRRIGQDLNDILDSRRKSGLPER